MKSFMVGVVIVVCTYVLGIVIAGYTEGSFDDWTSLLTNNYALFGGAGSFLLVLLYYTSNKKIKPKPSAGEGKTKEGKKMQQYYDARWITEKELLTDSRFMYNTYKTLPMVKKSGIVIRNLVKNGKFHINLYKPIHTLVIGTTGSGKTTLIIDPAIRILSATGEKPCLVITDPKGELYNKHSKQLRKQGYRVMVLDLRKPYASTRWNPMANAYTQYHTAKNLEKQVKVHNGGKPQFYKLKTTADRYPHVWYEWDGIAYADKTQLLNDIGAKRQEMIDQAENELREIASNIVPIESKNEPIWEQGAQDFLYGTMIAMLEDSMDPRLGMTLEKFNFYNLRMIATTTDPDPDNPYGTLRDYFGGRDKFSKVNALTSSVINNAPNTMRSYMGVLLSKIAIFQDGGICYATGYSDMKFDDFVSQPTVLFIKVPDEKESRHCIATMCISQLYKKLIDIASNSPGLVLPRPVYFLLDEFANLPKIEKMDTIITVARGRKIYFELVVQSYMQLNNKYGKDVADTIRGNCNIQIYLGTDDQSTKEDFSKLCGDISLEMENVSVSKGDKKEGGSSSTKSTQVVTRPLIGAYELGQLPYGTAIVKIFQVHPIKTGFTPYYEVPEFDKSEISEEYIKAQPFNEAEVFYDIRKRNMLIYKPRSSRFDGFDI
ncbi:MAG: type IV secretory system conjugative DNA transfer family protein [Clostridia bacterium]|nr:type IV secretory system conjugative DNA transfer family protein [Clostridia bacterium]